MADNNSKILQSMNRGSGNITPNSITSNDVAIERRPEIDFLLQPNQNVAVPGVTNVEEYTKYGVYPNNFFDYELARALAQTRWEQTGRSLAQMGTTIVGEAVSGLGAVPAIVEGISDEIKGGNADFTNAVMEFGQMVQDYGKERFPIYRERPNKSFDMLDFAWWADNAPSVASSIGLLLAGEGVTTGLVKGLNYLSKSAEAINIAGKGTKLTKALAAGLGEKGQYYTRLLTSASVMRNGENLKESSMTYNTLKDEVLNYSDKDIQTLLKDEKLKEQYKEDMNGKELRTRMDLAEYIAAKGAWRNYAVDAGNVVFDVIQLAPLLKGFKTNTRTILNPSKIVNANLKAAGKKELGKLASGATNLKYGLGLAGFETLTEGIEEAVNNIASNEGLHYGHFVANKAEGSNFGTRLSEYVKNPQLWEEAFWGSIGGAVFSGAVRGLKNVRDVVNDVKDPRSKRQRLEEIASRANKLKVTMGLIEQVNNGTNPYASAGEDPTIQNEEHANKIKNLIIQEAADNIGLNAATHGNTNLLLEQLNSPEFRQELLGLNKNTQEVDNLLNTLRQSATESETAYKDLYANIYNKAGIKDYVKGLLVNQGLDLHLNKRRYQSLVNDYTAAVNEDLSTPVLQAVQNTFNEEHKDDTGVTFTDSLNKAALQKLRTDLKRAINNDPELSNNPIVKRRTEKVLEEIDDRISKLDNNLGYNSMVDKVGERVIANNANKLGNELYLNGINSEFTELAANPVEKGKEIDDKLKEDAKNFPAKYYDGLQDEIKQAKTYGDLSRIERRLQRDKKKYRGYKELETQLNKIIEEIQAKKATVENEYKRRRLANEPEKTPADFIVEVDPEGGEVSYKEGTKRKEDFSEETSEEEKKKEREKKKEKDPLEGRIEETDYDYLTFNPTNISVFNSAIRNMQLELGPDGIVNLTEEQAKIYDIIFNQLKVGDNVYIKYDNEQPDITSNGQTRKRTVYEKRVGVYDSNDNLLFHLDELRIDPISKTISFSHKGLVYTPKNSWAKVFNYLVNTGRLDDIIKSIFDYRLARITNNKQLLTSSFNKLADSDLFNSIINTNRGVEFNTDSNEFTKALEHVVSVVTYGLNDNLLRTKHNSENLVKSIDNWSTKIHNDLLGILAIRNKLEDNPDTSLVSSITYKTNGSTILNRQDGEKSFNTIDKIVDFDSANIKLVMSHKDDPNTLYPANDAAMDKDENNRIMIFTIKKGVNNLMYIPLKMANKYGTTNYVPYPTQIADMSMENLPASVRNYNDKLLDFITNTINNNDDINKIYKILRYYVKITKPATKNYYNIHTKSFDAKGNRVVFRLTYNQDTGGVILTRGKGTVNLLTPNRIKDTIKEFKSKGIQRGVYLVPKVVNFTGENRKVGLLPSGTFVDQVDGKQYANYTEFLVKTGAIVTDMGAVKSNGKVISNASADNSFNVKGQPLEIKISLTNIGEVIQEKPRNESVRTTSLEEFGKQLVLTNPYANLFKLIDKIGVNFDSTVRIEPTEEQEILVYDPKTNSILITTRFDEIDSNGNLYGAKNRLLAHESIHRIFNDNLTVEQIKRLNNILKLAKNKFNTKEINELFTSEELITINNILEQSTKSITELVTYALTNPVMAKFLNSINMEDVKEPTSLARELLDIILNLIETVFGKTALTEITNILEESINNINNNDNTSSQGDPDLDLLNYEPANIIDSYIDRTVPSAIDYMRTLNKEQRNSMRESINNGNIIFKCI